MKHRISSFFVFFALLAFGLMISVNPGSAQSDKYDPNELGNNLTWGGYYEFEYEDVEGGNGSSPNGNFDQHRNILFFGAQPHERLTFFNELEIEHGGAPDVKFEQAWLEFALNDQHNFRAGIDLIPVGRLNIEHDGNLRDFVLRPKTDKQLIPTTWFESGAGFNGELTDNVSYQVGVSNGINSTSPGAIGTRDEFDAMLTSDLDENDNSGSKATWGRVAFNPALGTEVALSGYQTDYNGVDSIDFIAADFNHTRGPWEFKGEYVDIDKDQQSVTESAADPDLDDDGTDELSDPLGSDIDGDGTLNEGTISGLTSADGGYIEAAYHFFPEGWYDSWFARGFDNPTFTALGRFEDLSFDDASSTQTVGDYSYLSLGLNYRPTELMAFKAQYDVDDESLGGTDDQDRIAFGMVLGY